MVEWIHLAQDRARWQPVVAMATKTRVSQRRVFSELPVEIAAFQGLRPTPTV